MHSCPRGHWYFTAPCWYDLGSRKDFEERFPKEAGKWARLSVALRKREIVAESEHRAVCEEMPGKGEMEERWLRRWKTWGFHRYPVLGEFE
jgi:hypothetical protein